MNQINYHYKDRLFKFIFGNEQHKEWALSLYNSINGTNYTNVDELQFVTVDNFIYMGMHNDVGILCADSFDLYEHQSTFNPNLPIRFLLYASKIYERHIIDQKKNIHGEKMVTLPKSKFIVFYNGKDEIDDKIILKLSDLTNKPNDLEVTVTVLNINYGYNQELMDKCVELHDYALFVSKVKDYQSTGLSLEKAVEKTYRDLDFSKEINQFLLGHKAEVVGMLFSEEYEEIAREIDREEQRKEARKLGLEEGRAEGRVEGRAEGRAIGRAEGRIEGRAEGKEAVLKELLQKGYITEEIVKKFSK